MKSIFYFYLLLLVFALSCNKKSITSTSNHNSLNSCSVLSLPVDSVGQNIQLDSFPIVVGHQWTYKAQWQSGDACNFSCDSIIFTIKIISDTLIAGIRFGLVSYLDAKGLSSNTDLSFPTTSPFFYLVNISNGLHQLYSLANTDSTYLADSTVLLMSTLPEVNTWNSLVNLSLKDSLEKRNWVSYEVVITPAGIFNCRKLNVIDNSYSNNDGITYYNTNQYFSSKGLVQEIQTGEGGSRGPGCGPVNSTLLITLIAENF